MTRTETPAPPKTPSRARRWFVVAAVLLAAIVVARIVSPVPDKTLPVVLQDIVTLALSVLIEALPFITLGIVLSTVVRVWISDDTLIRILPRNPVGRRVVLSLAGILLPVCECGNVPLARGLMARGLTLPEAMTFLFAAPILNPITIITTFQVFGFTDGVLAARIIGGFVIANLIGWLYSLHASPERLLTPAFAAECAVDPHDEPGTRWQRSLALFGRESATLLPALVVGAILAGVVQSLVPRDVLIALGSHPVWSVLAMLALALIISVCSTVDSFFILPFASIFLPGSVVAFLIFGALIDIKMLALLRTTFTTRTLVQLTVMVALAAAAIGWGLNLVV